MYNPEASPSYHEYEQDRASSLFSNTRSETRQLLIQEEYFDEETEAPNKKGRDDLNDLYKNNQKFTDEIINVVRDETELSNKNVLYILYKKHFIRFKHNTLIKLGMETVAKFAFSKDHARI